MAITFTGAATSQFISGTSQGSQFILAIENADNSSRIMTIRRAIILQDCAAVLTAVKPRITAYRAAAPVVTEQGVAKLIKAPFDTTQTSDPYISIWTTLNPDRSGKGGLSCMEGARHWNNMSMRMHTMVEQIRAEDRGLIPSLVQSYPFILLPGEAYVVEIETATATSNPNTDTYAINLVWTEEPVATYTISGTVTLSGTGVINAKVVVMIADDTATAHPYLWQIVSTTTGGAWSSNIPTGKIAYAYAQNDVAGTLYTAPAAPFLS